MRAEWLKEFGEQVNKSLRGFESLQEQYRREYIGIYAQLWIARCLSLKGEYRRATGLFEELLSIDNRDLENFKREVFHFRLMNLAARGEHQQVVSQGEAWLAKAARTKLDNSVHGVRFEIGKAYAALAQASDGPEQTRFLEAANRFFGLLSSTPNAFTGLARREQLKLAEKTNTDIVAKSFQQMMSLAKSKVDAIGPSTPPAQKRAILDEAKDLFRKAIDALPASGSEQAMNEARLELAYTHAIADDLYEAAVLSESVARDFPAGPQASTAAIFAIRSYAMAYERLTSLGADTSTLAPELTHIRGLAKWMNDRWPAGADSAEAKILLGKIALSQRDYQSAISELTSVNKNVSAFATAQSLAGQIYWDWFKTMSAAAEKDHAALNERKDKAWQLLSESTPVLRSRGKIDRDRVYHEIYLTEAAVEMGKEADVKESTKQLVNAVAKNELPADIEPSAKTDLLAIALLVSVKLGDTAESDRIITLLESQPSGKSSSSASAVFVRLAARLREQLELLKSQGQNDKADKLRGTFSSFLERLADRLGQTTNFQNLIFLADNFYELGQFDRAISLVEKASNDQQANLSENRSLLVRGRLILANSQAGKGDFAKARQTIDQLYQENPQVKEVLSARGEILEKAGDLKAAVNHYRQLIERTLRQRPRPPQFYTAVEQYARLMKTYNEADKAKKLTEIKFILGRVIRDDNTLSPEKKESYQKLITELGG